MELLKRFKKDKDPGAEEKRKVEAVESDEPDLGRREFLRQGGIAGLAAVLAGVTGTKALAQVVLAGVDDAQKEKLRDMGLLEALEQEAANLPKAEGLSTLDNATSGAIITAFLGIIGGGLFFNVAMDQRTALLMNALAITRITVLKNFGNEQDKKIADEEVHELQKSLPPALVLTAISDLTTSELSVDVEELFESGEADDPKLTKIGRLINKILPSRELNYPDYKKVQRPSLEITDGSLAEWQTHKRKVEEDLNTAITRINSVGIVLAPLFSTYAPSAIANEAKKGVMHMLYEQSYAMEVVDRITRGEIKNGPLEPGESVMIREKAKERAEDQMNGTFGYGKLILALDSNDKGTVPPMGDPPEIYYALSLIGEEDAVEQYLTNFAFGLTSSLVTSIILNQIYLAKCGAFEAGRSMASLKESFKVGARLVQRPLEKLFGAQPTESYKFDRDAFVAKLRDGGGDNEAIIAQLQQMPEDFIQFNGGNYLRNKVKATNFILQRMEAYLSQYLPIIGKLMTKLVSLGVEHLTPQKVEDMLKGLFDKGTHALEPRVGRMDFEDAEAKDLADMFASITKLSDEAAKYTKDQMDAEGTQGAQGEQVDITAELTKRTQGITTEITKLRAFASRASQEDIEILRTSVAGELGIEAGASDTQIRQIIGKSDDRVINKALARYRAIVQEPDAVPGLGEGAHHEEKSHLLTHAAKEVLFALFTQIPVVGPLQHRLVHAMTPDKRDGFEKSELEKVANQAEKELEREQLIELIKDVNGGISPKTTEEIDKFIEDCKGLPKVEVGKRIMHLIIESSANLTPEKLKGIIWKIFTTDAVMSSIADNVAAYLMTEGTMLKLFINTFGEEVMKRKRKLVKWIKILSKKVAETAGALTKVGNGPNFSQEKLRIAFANFSDDGGDAIAIDAVELPLSETAYHKNGFALVLNGLVVAGSTLYINSLIDKTVEELENESSAA